MSVGCSYVLSPTASIFIVCYVGFISVYVYSTFVYVVFCSLVYGLGVVFGFRLTTVKEKLELVHVDICDLLILFTIFGEFVMMFWF
jgi:pilus assembly protein TadC